MMKNSKIRAYLIPVTFDAVIVTLSSYKKNEYFIGHRCILIEGENDDCS